MYLYAKVVNNTYSYTVILLNISLYKTEYPYVKNAE